MLHIYIYDISRLRVKTVLLAVLFGRNGNSYTTSAQSDMFIYIQILDVVEAVVGQKK